MAEADKFLALYGIAAPVALAYGMSNAKTPNSIADDVVVAIHYTLTLDDGTEVDSSRGSEPLLYLHGHSNIVPGLERQLEGRGVGEIFRAEVSAAEGYGPRFDDAVHDVSRSDLPDDFQPEVGMQLAAEMGEGQMITLHVVGVEGDRVMLDANHPLAGEALHFDVEVVALRSASTEEVTHGHPHGPGGHHH